MATIASVEDVQQAALDSRQTPLHLEGQNEGLLRNEFEQLYMTYYSRIWALCLRMTGNPDDADDLTQETFVRLFQKLSTFRGEAPFSTWLRRIAINVALLRFQKASWRHETSLEALSSPDPASGHLLPTEWGRFDTRLKEALDRISLERAIDQLPPGFRAVLILHDVEGYEHVEISALMGCSIGTSKSQLHKARLKMRELLQHRPVTQPV
jgi:RNA polymerase sigma-70 factor (ECF subfamily)